MNIYPPGTRIGQYEIAGRPLMGGMGIVYVCLDLEEDRPVALKTFKPEYLPDRAARDRFLREGTHWVDLGRHPHVVRCYEVLRMDLAVYLVLELVAKEQGRDDASLRAWLTPGRALPVETALLFALQIARGMKHAVETIPGFVHRDLKPENVLVGADRLSNADGNRLRVTDFGLVAVLQEASQRRSEAAMSDESSATSGRLGRTQLTLGVVGTPLYMAPEQWRGEEVTVATDVYALGCMLYEMVAGQRAVAGSSLRTLEQACCGGEVRPLPAGLPASVAELVSHCLAMEPGARYGSWEEVEAALGAAYALVAGRSAPEPEPAEALSREERLVAGWSYSQLGASYLDIGKAEVALGYFQRAWEVGRVEEERWLVAAALHWLGEAHRSLGGVQQAIKYHEHALTIYREIGNRQREGAALGNLGHCYRALGDARRATGYFKQQMIIAHEIGDQYGEADASTSLGTAYKNLGDLSRAWDSHMRALAIWREMGYRRGEAQVLCALGIVCDLLQNSRKAIELYDQALTILRGIGNRRDEGIVLGNLGVAYSLLGETQAAIGYSHQAIVVLEEVGDMTYTASYSLNLAGLLVQQGHLVDALTNAERAARLWDQMGHPRAQEAQQLVAQIRAALR